MRKRVRLTAEEGGLELNALIDTGANRLLIPREVAERLGVKPMFKVKAVGALKAPRRHGL